MYTSPAHMNAVSLDDKDGIAKLHAEWVRTATLWSNRVQTASLLIAHGGDVHAKCQYDQEPLAIALTYFQPELAKKLIENGANVNSRGKEPSRGEQTMLHIATQLGERHQGSEILKALLSHGASVNATNYLGATPLIWASFGNADAVRLLIEYGANVNAQDESSFTALTDSAAEGRLEIVRLLLEHGADPNLGESPIERAMSRRDFLFAENYDNQYGAAIQRYDDVIALLTKYGARITPKTGELAIEAVGSTNHPIKIRMPSSGNVIP